jgi:hypothetical protein
MVTYKCSRCGGVVHAKHHPVAPPLTVFTCQGCGAKKEQRPEPAEITVHFDDALERRFIVVKLIETLAVGLCPDYVVCPLKACDTRDEAMNLVREKAAEEPGAYFDVMEVFVQPE